MNKIFLLVWVIVSFGACSLFGQAIDNTNSLHDQSDQKYFRFHYDNDFFTATDYYYSQGINFELSDPLLRKFFLSQILLVKNNSRVNFGIAVEHDAYTPTSIRHNEISEGDRPFSACLMFKMFSVSIDTIEHVRLTSVFSTGVIGPSAFGEEMQKGIHHWLNDIQPLGWQNQIHNDIIINYEISHETQILFCGNNFALNSNVQLRAGTLSDKIQAGFSVLFGNFNSAFQTNKIENKKRFQFYFYSQPLVNLIAYDATLQGGLLNQDSPYKLDASQITRIVFQNNFGVVVKLKKIYLEYYQSILTKEFLTGQYHRWGGIKVGLNL